MAASPVEYARENRARFLNELKEFLRIPSVSAQPAHAKDVERAANFVADAMRRAGLENVKLLPTGGGKGNPIVYGDWLHAGADKPTVLVYGHYDVQPGEPFELWTSPPFEPTERDGKLWARGATDDKGQMICHVFGVESILKTTGSLPVNVKFAIEGEEEVGSHNLDAFVLDQKKLLASDVCLISDSAMWDEQHPSIVYSLRGLDYFFIDAKAASSDLHSGTYGGAAPNPVEWMAKLLASAKDPRTGRVLIPGFYDDVKVDAAERKALGKLPFKAKQYTKELGLKELFVEKGWTAIEATSIRPTFEVNGLWGGYTGPGQKTVLPNEAHAKISTRLVGNQDPEKVGKAVKKWVAEFAKKTPGVEFKIVQSSSNPPAKVPIDHPALGAGVAALRRAWPDAKDVVFAAEGGSIPVVATFQKVLGIPTVLMGFGLHDENLHAPNEHVRIENVHRGVEASAAFFEEVAKVPYPFAAGTKGAGRKAAKKR